MSESHYFSAGDRVRVTEGCNAGKFGKVKKLGHGNMLVQCEPEGVGWYRPDEVALVVTVDETPLIPEDVVNHPKHYTGHPEGEYRVECMYGTTTSNDSRGPGGEADTSREGCGHREHSMALRVRLRERDAGLSAKPEVGPCCELRVQACGGCCVQAGRQGDPERLCLRESTKPPAGEPSNGARAGAHIGHGGDLGAATSPWGGSSPQERGQGGQPPRELGALEQEPASGRESQRSGGVGDGDTQAVPTRESDPVDHPRHYTSSPATCSSCGAGIECIQITEHMGFNLGNALKYLWRCDLKRDAIEDLKKARWYIDREIAKREGAKP